MVKIGFTDRRLCKRSHKREFTTFQASAHVRADIQTVFATLLANAYVSADTLT